MQQTQTEARQEITPDIYSDIAARCGGDVYIGVVGPVRSGKSTFIKKFMETLVLPAMTDENDRARARDELPQSAAGRTVMTTEPKFIPDEAAEVRFSGGAGARVRLVDCVGYLIPDVLGHTENGEQRMVMTPWHPDPVPFEQAAEEGTRRVIGEHSTVGMLVTTDGTVGELGRENYVEAERRIAKELTELGKPFAVILNSADPSSPDAAALAYRLEEEYGAPVALVNCLDLDGEDIRQILELVLLRFPVTEIEVRLPGWFAALEPSHPVRSGLRETLGSVCSGISRIGDVARCFGAEAFEAAADENGKRWIRQVSVDQLDLSTGKAAVTVSADDSVFYSILRSLTGLEISDERGLIETMKELSSVRDEYEKIAPALRQAEEEGYGIVIPDVGDLHLEEPEIVRKTGGYGVRLRASAPSIHLIKANIETELSPMVGTEQQSEELVRYLLNEFEEDPAKIWSSEMFGKPLSALVTEGLHSKLSHMPAESRAKLSETLGKIINEGSGGLICIIL